MDVPVELRKAFLTIAVDVVGTRIACLDRSGEKGFEKRVRRRPTHQWTAASSGSSARPASMKGHVKVI